MTKGIFITAIGTDVGKTYISALIVKAMRNAGFNCLYYKPALSGAEIINGKLVAGDCEYVFKTSGINKHSKDYVSYIFKDAVSPHLASEIENKPIMLDKILKDFERIKSECDYLLVEGAGGIVCPFNLKGDKLLLKDVIKTLGLDIVIIASASLGTINSTVLTVEYARQNGINIKGIILNNFDKNNFMQVDNLKRVEELTGVKVIATVESGDENIGINNLSEIFSEC